MENIWVKYKDWKKIIQLFKISTLIWILLEIRLFLLTPRYWIFGTLSNQMKQSNPQRNVKYFYVFVVIIIFYFRV